MNALIVAALLFALPVAVGETICADGRKFTWTKDEFGNTKKDADRHEEATLCWAKSNDGELSFSATVSHLFGDDRFRSNWLPVGRPLDAVIEGTLVWARSGANLVESFRITPNAYPGGLASYKAQWSDRNSVVVVEAYK